MAESDVKPVSGQRTVEVLPSASRLTESLRDIGYDYVTAVADVVDNSVTAGARNVRIQVDFAGRESRIIIVDDGAGMSPRVLDEAMRFGSRRAYKSKDLGKFGLGLKTASLSQGRRLSVLTRSAPTTKRISARVLDLDWVDYADKWEVLVPRASEFDPVIRNELSAGPGTVVVWELLDRILSYRDPDSHWARRKFERLPGLAAEYLGMVFHRFLDGEIEGRPSLEISINDEPVQSWNPFALSERATKEMPAKSFNLRVGSRAGRVTLRPFILPSRSSFSSQQAFEKMSGPNKWNRQQGLYVYRAGRLIQHGGWCGLRTLDEHTKLARAAVEFDPVLDDLFQVNVAKMRASLPAELKPLLEKPVSELCQLADRAYREGRSDEQSNEVVDVRTNSAVGAEISGALRLAAMEIGETDALVRIFAQIGVEEPELSRLLQA